MEKIKECPYCFSIDDDIVYIVNRSTMGSATGIFYVYCDECGMRGPVKQTEGEAIEAWNLLKKR